MRVRVVLAGRWGWALAWAVVLLTAAGCSEARRSKAKKRGASPVAPVPAAGPITPPAAPASGAPNAVPPAATDPAPTAGQSAATTLRLSLPGQRRLGGFAFTATWDPATLTVGEPKVESVLTGYLCQANLATPGTLRFNCAGLPNDERGGLLATLPLTFKDRAPVVADLKVVQNEVVDDMGRTLPDVRLELAVGPATP